MCSDKVRVRQKKTSSCFTVKAVFRSPPAAENHLLESCSQVDFVQVKRTPPHLCTCSLQTKVSLFHSPENYGKLEFAQMI